MNTDVFTVKGGYLPFIVQTPSSILTLSQVIHVSAKPYW